MAHYRVTDPDYRTIAVIGRGSDAHTMIAEAIAHECNCDPDELRFVEEADSEGYWTGEEVALLEGAYVGRVICEA